jgi:hypothetical protein
MQQQQQQLNTTPKDWPERAFKSPAFKSPDTLRD